MPKMIVDVGHTKYPLYINSGGLKDSGKHFKDTFPKAKAVIISDSNVCPLYSKALESSLENSGIKHCKIVLPPGEATLSSGHMSFTSFR